MLTGEPEARRGWMKGSLPHGSWPTRTVVDAIVGTKYILSKDKRTTVFKQVQRQSRHF